MMTVAEKVQGLWPYVGIPEFKIVADYWATKIYRDKPYPERQVTYGYVYDDGSILTLKFEKGWEQDWADCNVVTEIPGWSLVENREEAA